MKETPLFVALSNSIQIFFVVFMALGGLSTRRRAFTDQGMIRV